MMLYNGDDDNIKYECDNESTHSISTFSKESIPSLKVIESIEQVFYLLYKKSIISFSFIYSSISKDAKYLNILPEYYIKPIIKNRYENSLSDKLIRYLYYDDLSLLFPDLNKFIENHNQDPFLCYIEIIQRMKIFENEITNEYKIEQLRCQAICMLKKAHKQSNIAQIKIELAIQYINGKILPYNLYKALSVLNSIDLTDKKTKELVEHLINKIKSKIQSEKTLLQNLPQKQKEILQKAKNGDVLSLMYVGFAFYTGFDGFPILHSLSIYYYRKAAKNSHYAMNILGYFYLNGIIFPCNFQRARNCFKRSADNGYLKAEIINGMLRKHLYRIYLVDDLKINDIIIHYLPSFRSMISNDSLVFSRLNYLLDANIDDEIMNDVDLYYEENEFHSEKYNEIYSMFINFQKEKTDIIKKMKPAYSEKIRLFTENIEKNNLSQDDILQIGKSYFSGDNNFPINYSKAAEYFKLSADKGNSEAQWRYAIMCQNSIGVKNDLQEVEHYFHESAKQNNSKGKFYYALFLREKGDIDTFEKLIIECCNSENLDAMYYYSLHLESKYSGFALNYYQMAADKGNLDSLIRLIYLSKYKSREDLYEKYLNLSVGMLNECLIAKLINLYDKNKKYDYSNILIQFGIKINKKLFMAFYIDHLLYGKGIDADEDKAEKLAFMAFNHYSYGIYFERYIYIILEIFIRHNEHHKAVKFLLQQKNFLTTEFRNKFILFYKKLDKNIAFENLITINFYDEEYRECYKLLLELKKENNRNFVHIFSELTFKAKVGNPYAMVILGRFYKNGKHVVRDLIKAVQHFECAAKKKCPEGYYYLGKEYLYGRILNQDFNLAKKYLMMALDHLGEPRAGYYLYKIPNISDDDKIDDAKALEISANFGYKRALYKYGHRLITGKDKRITKDDIEGQKLIQYSASQNYKKAIRYCNYHGLPYIKKEKNPMPQHKKTKKTSNNSSNEDESLSDFSNTENKEDHSNSCIKKGEENYSDSKIERYKKSNSDVTKNEENPDLKKSKSEENNNDSNNDEENSSDFSSLNTFWF